MSFADELREYDKNADEKLRNAQVLETYVESYIGHIKEVCKSANYSGSHSVSGYFAERRDSENLLWFFTSDLPSLKEYYKQIEEFNSQNNKAYDGVNYNYKTEYRLYAQVVSFDSEKLDFCTKIKKRLEEELEKLGFTSYKVSIKELDDTYITISYKVSFWGRVEKELSTRTNGKVYYLHISISW